MFLKSFKTKKLYIYLELGKPNKLKYFIRFLFFKKIYLKYLQTFYSKYKVELLLIKQLLILLRIIHQNNLPIKRKLKIVLLQPL